MGIYISIQKISEDNNSAEYRFEGDAGAHGKLAIDKKTGNLTLLQAVPEGHEYLIPRAIRKLQQHWEKGEFPDKTCWAS